MTDPISHPIEVRVSTDGRVAYTTPEQLQGDDKRWFCAWWSSPENPTLQVALMSEEDVATWRTVYRDRPTTED